MAKHSELTGNNLHEPKGVATAAANTVYVADGAGTGSWTTIPGIPPSQVIVSDATDFPDPVANVITLAADTVYFIDGAIDIGDDRIVMGSNTQIRGHGASLSSITTTNTGNIITATGSHQIHNIAISASAGTIFSCTGGSTESAYYTNFQITACATVGTFSNWYSLVWQQGAVVSATTAGLDFSGTCRIFIIDLVEFFSSTGTAIDLGTATFNTVSLIRCGFSASSGTHLAIAASSANINSGYAGRILYNKFNTSATVSTGYAATDARWEVVGNYGLVDTIDAGQGYITGNATATSFGGTGDGNEVVAAFGTSFVADIQSNFTVSNAGRFTCNSAFPHYYKVSANFYATQSSGADRVYTFYIAKGGTKIASSVIKRTYSSGNPGAASVDTVVQLSSGEYIELYVQAETAATNLTIETCSISVIGV